MKNFSDFIEFVIKEELHPELKEILADTSNPVNKKTQILKKIKELSSRNQKTGIEHNMPQGSSRAYMKHDEDHHIILDGKSAKIPVGTKFAIKAHLDKYHNKAHFDDMSLGQLQNRVENDGYNNFDRIIQKNKDGTYNYNKHGFLPPLIDHDSEHHNWSTVGHISDLKSRNHFKQLTKNESHPKGINFNDFCESCNREYQRANGAYWKTDKTHENHLDHVSKHPFVESVTNNIANTGLHPGDFSQLKNLGVWTHPHTGKQHVIIRDHGFDHTTSSAYAAARNAARKIKYGF